MKYMRMMITGLSRSEKLLKVTKRLGYSKVVELEFGGDAIVAVCVPTILTKGATPPDLLPFVRCKEEVPNTMESVGSSSQIDEGAKHDAEAMLFRGA